MKNPAKAQEQRRRKSISSAAGKAVYNVGHAFFSVVLPIIGLAVTALLCVVSIFHLEGIPGPFSRQVQIFASDMAYLSLGTSFGIFPCQHYACNSDMTFEVKKSAQSSSETLGSFQSLQECEKACLKFKVESDDSSQNVLYR